MPRMSDAVKIQYKGAIDNLLFLKRQQWVITNYSLIVYAAVIALAKDASDQEKAALTVLATIGCVYAIHCMRHTQKTLTRYYNNLFDMQKKYLTAAERVEYKTLSERPGFNHNGEFIWGLIIANGLAFLLTFYLIWWKNGFPLPTKSTAQTLLSMFA